MAFHYTIRIACKIVILRCHHKTRIEPRTYDAYTVVIRDKHAWAYKRMSTQEPSWSGACRLFISAGDHARLWLTYVHLVQQGRVPVHVHVHAHVHVHMVTLLACLGKRTSVMTISVPSSSFSSLSSACVLNPIPRPLPPNTWSFILKRSCLSSWRLFLAADGG